MESKPVLDVLVIAHNHLELTSNCLLTLYKYTTTPFHLIVIDDSTDLTPLWMNQFCKEHSNVTYVHSAVPYKCGNQIFEKAFEYCQTPYMATVMNSIRVEPDWEISSLQLMNLDDKIGVVGMKCLFPNGLIESAGIQIVKYLPCDMGRDNTANRFSLNKEVSAVQWAFALVRVEAAKGKLDVTGFHGFKGWDDIDNCLVMKEAGWKIVYCGASSCYHEPRSTRGDNGEQATRENRENGIYFYKKHGFWEDFKKEHPDSENVHLAPKGAPVRMSQ